MGASTGAQKVVGAGRQDEGREWVEQLVSVTAVWLLDELCVVRCWQDTLTALAAGSGE